MAKGREQESLTVLAGLRRKPIDDEGIRLEFLEIKGQHMFEQETSIAKFPNYQDGGFMNNVKLGFYGYLSLLTNRSLFKRVVVAVFIMVFQQCEFDGESLGRFFSADVCAGSGINAIVRTPTNTRPISTDPQTLYFISVIDWMASALKTCA
jgi:hypothetical protein